MTQYFCRQGQSLQPTLFSRLSANNPHRETTSSLVCSLSAVHQSSPCIHFKGSPFLAHVLTRSNRVNPRSHTYRILQTD